MDFVTSLWRATETYRLTVHLTRALNWLRSRPYPSQRRLEALFHLEKYIKLQEFPRNTEGTPGYSPIFIDREGRYCAVGYLVAQTQGREAAEALDRQFHLGYVQGDMQSLVQAWGADYSLSVEELAFVQPGYFGLDAFICNFVVMGLLSILLCVFFLLYFTEGDELSEWLFYGSVVNLAVQVIQFVLIFIFARKTNAPLLTATGLHCVFLVYLVLVLALVASTVQGTDMTLSWVFVGVFGLGVGCCLCPCSILCFDVRNEDFNFDRPGRAEEPLITNDLQKEPSE